MLMPLLYHKNRQLQNVIDKNYLGIWPKCGGTINLWFSSTIGSVSHLCVQPITVTATTPNKTSDTNFFITYPFFFILHGARNAPQIITAAF